MAFTRLQYSKSKIRKSGKNISKKLANEEDFTRIKNWRSCHSYPLNTLQASSRGRLKAIQFDDYLFAQRLKRLPTIIRKLQIEQTMSLTTMGDIGGLRIIVKDVLAIRKVVQALTGLKHPIHHERDYLTEVKPSGYAGYHCIYSYNADGRDSALCYHGMYVELQVRTLNQHAWATAVETMGTVLGQPLKSSIGDHEILNYFYVLGKSIHQIDCESPLDDEERISIFDELLRLEKNIKMYTRLDTVQKLATHGRTHGRGKGAYCLIQVDYEKLTLETSFYKEKDLQYVEKLYGEKEAAILDSNTKEIVLIKANSLSSVKKMYPNYMGDTDRIKKLIQQIVNEARKRPVKRKWYQTQ